jgi:hypothetical protein
MGPILKLKQWDIHPAHLRASVYLLGPFGGAQMPQKSIKNYFWVVLYYFSYKNGPNDLVRGLFSSLNVRTYIPATCGLLSTFLGPFVGAQMPQDSIKKAIIWLFWVISPGKMGLMIWLGAYF